MNNLQYERNAICRFEYKYGLIWSDEWILSKLHIEIKKHLYTNIYRTYLITDEKPNFKGIKFEECEEEWFALKKEAPDWPGFHESRIAPELQSTYDELLNRSIIPAEFDPNVVCKICNKPLRTINAKQCFECGADWH